MKTLNDIPIKRVHQVQQKALLRMLLYVTGETHRLLGEATGTIRAALLDAANREGKIDGLGMHKAKTEIERVWGKFTAEYKSMVKTLRTDAATLPFGTLALYHEKLLQPALAKAEKSETSNPHPNPPPINQGREIAEDKHTFDFVFNPQLAALLHAADRRIYKDGLQLSQRIWNLDHDSLDQLNRILAQGVANGASAWDVAKEIEGYLGAGKDCPRWTSTRLYGLTKRDIAAGDKTGMIGGDDCRGQGVSYNALRLARTEIQAIHALATDAAMQQMPWIEQEQIVLSPAHPTEDECDDVVNGGENGDGIYPKGETELPIHPSCLCLKLAVLMDPDQFANDLRGWKNGTKNWPAMDQYQQNWGGQVNANLGATDFASVLPKWAFEDPFKFLD